MSSSLPPEILDLIIDHLHDKPTTLKTCCVVSKSWVPRTRRHLFARVEFHAPQSPVELWKKTFPDPSNSPAYHTHTLSINSTPVTAAGAGMDCWIHSFCNVISLRLLHMDPASLTPFYGFSPTLRSLSLTHVPLDGFDLICSFPLLEDLALVSTPPTSDPDGWNMPLTSPKLTGTLDLRVPGSGCSVARRLVDLPGGLHFAEIYTLLFFNENAKSLTDLVLRCSDTLESLTICYRPKSAFPSAPVTTQHLIAARRHVHIWVVPLRPLYGHETQISELCAERVECPMGQHGAPNRQIRKPSIYRHPPI